MAKTGKQTDEVLYSKEAILFSEKYCEYQDLLNVLLNEEDQYSTIKVDEMIKKFMKGVV